VIVDANRSRSLRINLFVAPMAGSRSPFRQLCKKSCGLAVSEMVARIVLWGSEKRVARDHEGEVEPISVQIAGGRPVMMAEPPLQRGAGAQIVDINMAAGKESLQHPGGSALLKDEPLVGNSQAYEAVNVPSR